MGARCITSVWIGYHVAKLAVIRLGKQNRGGGGGTRGAVGNRGDRQDWQRSNTHNPNHISLPLRLHIYPH